MKPVPIWAWSTARLLTGTIIGAGPEDDFPIPPTVVADPNRRSLSTAEFLQPELDERILQHHFEPGRSRLHPGQPRQRLCLLHLRAEVGYADQGHRARRHLQGSLASRIMPPAVSTRPGSTGSRANSRRARTNDKLMIIAAHIPINPQADLSILNRGTILSSHHLDR